METLLIAITAVALAMTAVMAVIVVTVLRQERARSEARVAALSAMAADAHDGRTELLPHERREHEVRHREPAAPPFTPVPEPVQAVSDRHVHLFSDRDVVDDVDELEIRPEAVGVSSLFSEPERTSPWGRRFVVIGCLAAALVLVIGMTMVLSRSKTPPATVGASAAQPSTATDVSPLELLSLRYSQESDRMVITGVVQNPRGAAPISRVVATAFLFGKDGSFLSSGRAPLDFVTLTPGEESPFVVNIPVTGQVTRYRVGFRTEDGRV